MQPQLIAGRYQVLRAIGRGGMGTVWLCRDNVLGREVAVKQMGALPGESATETKRAMREARSAAALNHPNVVAVYDVVNHNERPWLVMEYVEGQTLADEISRDGQLSPRRVADIGAQLAGALARAHERRIVHRDIKPANVLIDKAGRPKISDFGIARGHGDDQLTAIGFITGTPGYLSPELARGEDPHPASDVWALGATLYAAVEGRPPFEPRSNPIAVLRAITTERPRPMTHAGALAPAIEAMMHADPACRWDMATSAKRLRRIAIVDPTAVMPMLQPGDSDEATKQLEVAALLVESTRQFEAAAQPGESTRQFEAAAQTAERTKQMEAAAQTAERTKQIEAAAQTAERTKQIEAPGSPVEPTKQLEVAAQPAERTRQPDVVSPPAESTKRLQPAAPRPVESTKHSAVAAPPRDYRGSSRRRAGLVSVALLLAALGVGYLLSQLGDQGGTAAVLATTSATTPAKSPAPGVSKVTEAPSTGGEHKDLEHFVKSYYADVTKDTDRTWDELSPRMQDFARGRDGYDGFWRTIEKVKVNRFRAYASDTKASVDLTFTRNDGTTSTEIHQVTFITDNGDYFIDSDRLG